MVFQRVRMWLIVLFQKFTRSYLFQIIKKNYDSRFILYMKKDTIYSFVFHAFMSVHTSTLLVVRYFSLYIDYGYTEPIKRVILL